MRTCLGLLAVFVTTVGTMGCVPIMALNASDAMRIHTIAVTGFDEPKYATVEVGTIYPDFNDLSAAMMKQNFHLGAELRTAVEQALTNAGYGIQAGDSSGAVDAFLEGSFVVVLYGPADPIILGGFSMTPAIGLHVELVDSRTKKLLFAKDYGYGVKGPPGFRPDPMYMFKSGKDVISNAGLAVEGFRASESIFAKAITMDLAGP